MALSLGVEKGLRIQIDGKHTLTVLKVMGPNRVLVKFQGREFTVTDLQRETLLPGVFVQCGLARGQSRGQQPSLAIHYARLAFEAPKTVKIQRLAA